MPRRRTNAKTTFTYTNDGGVGTDHIQAAIGSAKSNIVEMIWKPKNLPPVAKDDSYTPPEDTSLTGKVTDNDTDPTVTQSSCRW